MKLKKFLNESNKIVKEIENFLKISPDYILYNSTRLDVKRYKNAEFLISLLQKPNDTVTIGKHTLEGIVSIQLYLDNGKVKIDKNR